MSGLEEHWGQFYKGWIDRRVIEPQDGLFPANPFPSINSKKKARLRRLRPNRSGWQMPCRADVIALHNGTFNASNGQALTV